MFRCRVTGETVDLSQCQSVPDKEIVEDKVSEVRMKTLYLFAICILHCKVYHYEIHPSHSEKPQYVFSFDKL